MVCSYVNDLFQQFHSHNNYIKWINYWVVYAYAPPPLSLFSFGPVFLHHHFLFTFLLTRTSKAVSDFTPVDPIPTFSLFCSLFSWFCGCCIWMHLFGCIAASKMLIVGAVWTKGNVSFYKHGLICLFVFFFVGLFRLFFKILQYSLLLAHHSTFFFIRGYPQLNWFRLSVVSHSPTTHVDIWRWRCILYIYLD